MKTLKHVFVGVGIGGSILLGGCAAIVGDSQYPVAITSSPDQVQFTIRNRAGTTIASGLTPTTLTLKSGAGFFRGETYTLSFSKEGYADQDGVLNSELSGWYFGNIVFGGLIGMLIVDPATGAMWKLPPSISASLSPKSAAADATDALRIVTIDHVPTHQRDFLIRVN